MVQQQLRPRQGPALVRFAREVVDLLRANPTGLDQDAFITACFDDKPPADQEDKDFYWNEFKRAARYSTVMFDLGEEGWSFVRALRGPRRGQFYYLAVATIISGQPTVEYLAHRGATGRTGHGGVGNQNQEQDASSGGRPSGEDRQR